MAYRTLHTLNSARVCMEYCVIHYHLSGFFSPSDGGLLSNGMVADNLMSFFSYDAC